MYTIEEEISSFALSIVKVSLLKASHYRDWNAMNITSHPVHLDYAGTRTLV